MYIIACFIVTVSSNAYEHSKIVVSFNVINLTSAFLQDIRNSPQVLHLF